MRTMAARKKKSELPPLRVKIITLTVGDLKKYENNPRIDTGGSAMVGDSIKDLGYQSPIIVTKDNVIVSGHTRLKAIKKLGYPDDTPIDVKLFEGTADQAKAFRLIDNKTSEGTGWDFELLEVETEGIDMNLDSWFPELELDDAPEEDAGIDAVVETTDMEVPAPSEPKKKTIVCPHCGQTIEL